jgi:hypothetical protein
LLREPSSGQPIAHHNPVSQSTIEQAALAARLAHYYLGVMIFASDGEIDRIKAGEHVEVKEAIVDRRD